MTFYKYDVAGQLTNEVSSTVTNNWQYDEAGNWLNAPQSGSKWVYNPENELIARANSSDNTWGVTVTGEVEPGPESNKWYHTTAEARGVVSQVSQTDGTFSLPNVPLYAGENELVVTVTDVSGNQSTESRTVTKTNASEIFRYDGNGNLTNWVSGSTNWTYEWDWAERLTKVNSNGVVVLQNWYDVHSRRIAKQEIVNGQTKKWLYLYDGWSIVGVMNENGQLLETFTRGVGRAGDIGRLVAITHHGGSSVAPGTYYAQHNPRGDVVAIRNGATTIGTYEYSAFGDFKTQSGTDVCRFKFLSKEREASCGFDYYGYRFYAPRWQRWLSQDPAGDIGVTSLYQFVRNDPVKDVDAYGLQSEDQQSFADCWTDCMKTMVPLPVKILGCFSGLGALAAKIVGATSTAEALLILPVWASGSGVGCCIGCLYVVYPMPPDWPPVGFP